MTETTAGATHRDESAAHCERDAHWRTRRQHLRYGEVGVIGPDPRLPGAVAANGLACGAAGGLGDVVSPHRHGEDALVP